MKPQQPDPKKSAIAVDALLQGDLDEEISDEEANEEIVFPDAAPAAPQNAATPPAAAADDTTPSVRTAVNKAADMMRQLRSET